MNELTCPKKHKKIILVEYFNGPYRYDGISEVRCLTCKKRFGRWSKKVLKKGELEPPFGDSKLITNKLKHYNL